MAGSQDAGKLDLIDVSDLEGMSEGNGQWYFTSSPWVSSDILANIGVDFTLDQRDFEQNFVIPSTP